MFPQAHEDEDDEMWIPDQQHTRDDEEEAQRGRVDAEDVTLCFLFVTLCFLFVTLCFLFVTLCFLFVTLCFLSDHREETQRQNQPQSDGAATTRPHSV